MDRLTVRRWIEAPAEHVWDRIVDVDALATEERAFDLVDLPGGSSLAAGDLLVVCRRHGPRVSTFEVHVTAARPPHHLGLAVVSGRLRWAVTIDVAPCDTAVSDLIIGARPDPGGSGAARSLPHPSTPASRRLTADLADLLEAVARRAAGPVSASAG